MLDEAGWVALGVAATLFGEFIAHHLGWIQITLMREQNALNREKALPKLEAVLRLVKRQENSSAFPPFYYVSIILHNHGELPAKQLKGTCKLFSPSNPSHEITIPIAAEFLGSSPRDLELERLDRVFIDPQRPKAARINVEIDFSYVAGFPEEKNEKYHAKYEYDAEREQFLSS